MIAARHQVSSDESLFYGCLFFTVTRPTAQVFADAFHDRESRQHLAVASGPGSCTRSLPEVLLAPSPRLKELWKAAPSVSI
jgi:hypothetical protein